MGVIGPVTFVVLDLIASALRPGYDLTFDTISQLAVGPLGWLQTLNFVFIGISTILMGVGLTGKARVQGGLFILWGIGFLLIALLPMDPANHHSLRHRLHFVALDGITVLFPIMCLAAVFTFWQRQRSLSLFSLVVFLFALGVAGSFLIWQETILASNVLGFYERFVIWVAVVWCVVLSWKVGKIAQRNHKPA
jgi:hypothetical membrane protein